MEPHALDATFKVFRQFNDPELQPHARVRHRVGRRALVAFQSNTLPDRVARAMAETQAIDVKELLESFEFMSRIRKRLRGTHIVDLCCGHGLTGMLFALLEKEVEQVTLIDRARPKSHTAILDALCTIGPWVRDKVVYIEDDIFKGVERLSGPLNLLAVHACGVRTDRCIDLALAHNAPIAAMPCCYAQTGKDAPEALTRNLGRQLATDIQRTYRLEAAGYRVDWSAIPRAITPMNRILVAWHPPGL